MPKLSEVIKIKPRRCKYCRVMFAPVCRNEQQRTNAEAQKFCCPAHRKSYHLNGGINFDQLVEKVAAKVHAVLWQDDKFIREIAARLKGLELAMEFDARRCASRDAVETEVDRIQRIKSKLTGDGPIGREAAQALLDSFSPCK